MSKKEQKDVPTPVTIEEGDAAIRRGDTKVNMDGANLGFGGKARGHLLALGDALCKSTTLECLGMAACSLGDPGVNFLCTGIVKCHTLQWIGLFGNSLTDRGVDYLITAITLHPSLTTINIGGNPDVTPAKRDQLLKLLEKNKKQIYIRKKNYKPLTEAEIHSRVDRDWGSADSPPVTFSCLDAKPPACTRKDLSVPLSRVCTLDGFLSPAEAKGCLAQAVSLGFSSLSKEFLPTYRNNERCVVYSPQLSELMWARLKGCLVAQDIEGVTPFGFDKDGKWVPKLLGSWWKFSKYDPNTFFKPHMDSAYILSSHERSIYTLMIFLNDDCEGGCTSFFSRDINLATAFLDPKTTPKPLHLVKPKIGRALLFNHDTVHAGEPVTSGFKYIMRTELVFERTSVTVNTSAWIHSAEYQRAKAMLQESDRLEALGRLLESCQLYLQAMDLQSTMGSFVQSRAGVAVNKAKWPLDHNVCSQVFLYLSLQDIMRLTEVSLLLLSFARDSVLWQRLYQLRWPAVCDVERSLVAPVNPNKVMLKDWYTCFKQTHLASTQFQAMILDFGQASLKFGLAGEEMRTVSNLVALEPSMHYNLVGKGEDDAIRVGKEVVSLAVQPYRTTPTEVMFIVNEYKVEPKGLERAVKHIYSRAFASKNNVLYSLSGAYGRVGADREVNWYQHPALVAVPMALSSWKDQDLVRTVLFELGVPFVGFADSALLVLAAYGLRSGVVVDLGQHCVCVVVKEGKRLATTILGQMGSEICGKISAGGVRQQPTFPNLRRVDACVERVMGSMALKRHGSPPANEDYQIGYEHLCEKVKDEAVIEELFGKPFVKDTLATIRTGLKGVEANKRPQLEEEMLSHVVLTGGLSMIHGVTTRFEKEMNTLLGACPSPFRLFPAPVREREADVVLGGMLVAQTSSARSLFTPNPSNGAQPKPKKR